MFKPPSNPPDFPCKSLPTRIPPLIHAEYLERLRLPQIVTGYWYIWRIANCSLSLCSISRAIGRQRTARNSRNHRVNRILTVETLERVPAESHVPDYYGNRSILSVNIRARMRRVAEYASPDIIVCRLQNHIHADFGSKVAEVCKRSLLRVNLENTSFTLRQWSSISYSIDFSCLPRLSSNLPEILLRTFRSYRVYYTVFSMYDIRDRGTLSVPRYTVKR